MARVVKLGRRGKANVVTLDMDGEAVTLSLTPEEIIEYGIIKGGELRDDAVNELLESVEARGARKKALSILSFGDKSVAGLYDRLLRSGYSRGAARDAVDYVLSYGYIDEKRQIKDAALRLALRELRSRAFIRAKLISLGYAESDIDLTIDGLVLSGEIDFTAVGERLAESLGAVDPEEKRLLLLKRGFIQDEF